MNNESTGQKPGEEDSWETLAENLFGIDFAKSPDAEDAIAADELLEDLIEEPPVTVESPAEQIAPAEELPTGFDEPELEPEPVSSELAGVEDAVDDGDADEAVETDSEPSESEPEVVAEEEDPYWDALKDWQWDDTDAESPESSAPRRPAGRRSPRRESRPPAAVSKPEPEQVSDYRDEFNGDSDFGAGLLEAEPSSGAAAPTQASPTDSQEPSEPTRKRRRRRRRRGDKTESTSAESAATAADEETQPVQAEADSAATQDKEAVTQQDQESSPERKPRRRRSRRRRAPDAAESAAPTVEATAAAAESTAPAESAAAEPDADFDEPEVEWEGDGGESESHPQDAARHRNLPTWEEAISYLLDPSLVKSERGETEREKPDAKTAPSGKSESSRPRRRRRRKS